MVEYSEPTYAEFSDAEATISNIVTKTAPNAITKAGSVVRELLIRPAAFVYAWASGEISDLLEKSSVKYLKSSAATENEVADAVASNYFVTRKQGSRASGVITLTVTRPVINIPLGSGFVVGGVSMATTTQIFLTNADMYDKYDDVTYIKTMAYGDNFIANIPVTATSDGAYEIPVDTTVYVDFVNNYIIDAVLTSPISGGSGPETDADMMVRAEYNTASAGVGSYYGIMKKYASGPVDVLSMHVIAGESENAFRARYNNTNINPGGFVDSYVKTRNQAAVGSFTMNAKKIQTQSGGPFYSATYPQDINDTNMADIMCSGFYRVVSVIADGATIGPDGYTVKFGSADPLTDAVGSRLSDTQTASIEFSATVDPAPDNIDILASVEYMPGIHDLQSFMDMDENKFIGQDIKVKAAVPVTVSIACAAKSKSGNLQDADISAVRRLIADTINSSSVGITTLNFSDIAEKCGTVYPDIELRLPCTMFAEIPLKDGSVDSYSSTAGILTIKHPITDAHWPPAICFFSTTVDKVRVAGI